MALEKQKLVQIYRKRAGRYDLSTAWLFRLMGFRVERYRRLTVDALSLKRGDTVVDLACGTGLNFPHLERAIGPEGRIIGVDIADAMLGQARERVGVAGWRNVELVRMDLAQYPFPSRAARILSTLAITLVPEYDDVIRRAAGALQPGGRLAVLDLKKPGNWPAGLIRFGAWLNRPYGVTLDLADRHPWESVRRHLCEVTFREFYFGAAYLSVGESRSG
jgi:demethylmenaquinone methyltransferase/2-methoxy-6-polyprenyl-1,4-benzoquinol methylase